MFDFGWQEFLVIAFVLVLVVGPKDLPKVLKTVTKYIRNMRQMASEFHRGIEKMADEADLKDSFNELKNNNIDKTIQSHLDPDNEVTKALQQAKDSADLANETNKVKETLKKHYPKVENLVLLKVNAFNLEHLLWEQASNGDMYPHLYSPLDIKNVVDEFELTLDDSGIHILPEILKEYQFSRPR